VYCADPRPSNPFERLADPQMNERFRKEQATRDAWFYMLVQAHTRLQREWGGSFSRVPLPRVVMEETKKWRYHNDPMYRFCCDNIVLSPASEININDFSMAFRRWASEQDTVGLDVGAVVREIGISFLDRFIQSRNGFMIIIGLRMASEPQDESEKPFGMYDGLF
jgi:phage/plasmid-associated DNA primase